MKRIVVAALLLVALPVFLWAVATQRIELRKKAATSEPPQQCWNRVGGVDPNFYWPDGCRGLPPTSDRMCTMAIVELTASEIFEYKQWLSAGRPNIAGCTPPTPTPTTTRINWQTPNVSLQADEMTLEVNGMIFKGRPDVRTPVALHSDPGTYNYTTLESIWRENGVEMRVLITFASDCTSSLPLRCNRWTVSNVRIYNGRSPGDWINFYDSDYVGGTRPTGLWGQPSISPSFELSSSGGGVHTLTFRNLRLQPFLSQTQLPTPTPTCIPRPACLDANPRCLLPENENYCPRIIPPGCYYQQVQCVRAPCNPVLVCASPTPTRIPTPTPYIRVLSPNGREQLTVGQTYTIRWQSSPNITNYHIYLINSLGETSLINGVLAPDTSLIWRVDSPMMRNTNLHKIKVVDGSIGIENATPQDLSDNFFSIVRSTTPTPTTDQKPGDANGDGKIDGIDYIVWANHYGQIASGSANGDFNSDGNVDGVDYIIWLNNYI